MRELRVRITGAGITKVLPVLYAERPAQRLRGLLGREALLAARGLWISPCSAVHTFGMRGAIDLVFVAADGTVLRIVTGLRPARMRWCRGAAGVLELAPGTALRLRLDARGIRLAGLGARA